MLCYCYTVAYYSKYIIYWISLDNNQIYNSLPNANINKFKKINLYLDYRAQLKSFKKINFDSFRRHDRITFIIEPEKKLSIETTLGQLNFFKWAFSNQIINYALKNQKVIYENMSKNNYKKNKIIPCQDILNTKCYVSFD